MSNTLLGGNRRCTLLMSFEALGQLLYIPAGGRITGVDYDHKRQLLLINVEGGVSGSVTPPGSKPEEVIAMVDHQDVHIVRWPDDAASRPDARTVPITGSKPALNFGQNIMPPPVAPAKDEPKIVEMSSGVEPSPAKSPCEAPGGDDDEA